jgi:hypothetical protein
MGERNIAFPEEAKIETIKKSFALKNVEVFPSDGNDTAIIPRFEALP